MRNFVNTGEFTTDYPSEVKRKYGEVRSASEPFQNDIHNLTIGYYQMKNVMENSEMESGLKGLYLGNLVEHYIGYFGVMVPVISVKPCHLKDHAII